MHSLMCLLVASLSIIALGDAIPFAGNCSSDLMPASGAVYRQLCLWTDPNAGVLDIPMLVGLSAEHPGSYAYVESWGTIPGIVGPSYGSQYGALSSIGPGLYNQSTSCWYKIHSNAIITSTNHTWAPQPSATAYLNVFADQGIAMVGQGVACVDSRIYGDECVALLNVLVANLTSGVPAKRILYDPNTVCDPY